MQPENEWLRISKWVPRNDHRHDGHLIFLNGDLAVVTDSLKRRGIPYNVRARIQNRHGGGKTYRQTQHAVFVPERFGAELGLTNLEGCEDE